jgi:hypothetical protein
VVVFSAFPAMDRPPRYTYWRALSEDDWNKLFILDDLGGRGCYYLGKRRDFFVEEATAALIDQVLAELELTRDDVVACGSSKGGFSALYFAFRRGYGHVVAGGPQTRIGTFLMHECPAVADVAELIAGGLSEGDREFLDSLLFDAVRSSPHAPDLHLHVGRDDLARHVRPLTELLESLGRPYRIEIADYEEHGGLTHHFQPFLRERVQGILSLPKPVSSIAMRSPAAPSHPSGGPGGRCSP